MRNTMHAAGWLSAAALLSACGAAPPPEEAAQEEPAPVVVSRWTDRSELFVEFPPLVAGATSRFAIHFTDLATFEPLREGRATVRRTGVRARAEDFVADGPGRPGIFGVDVTPAGAGRARLELLLDAAAGQDRHDLGEVTVLTAAEAARLPPVVEEEDGTVPFLKEQQWSLDFATAAARRRSMAAGLDIPKSNWANAIDEPPFEAYAVTCGVTFTFGGLKIATDGQVVDTEDAPMPGLFAAGELVGGLFFVNYPGGTGLTSGAVFGRIAGRSAAIAAAG